MILTVTLNVAVDKAYVLETPLRVGEVMRVKSCNNTAGGKGLNVAKTARLCGADVLATGFVGGCNGAYVEQLLQAKGVPADFVHVHGETRSCINVLDGDGKSTEFLEPGAPVTREEEAALFERLSSLLPRCEVVTFSGSAPVGMGTDIYARLIDLCRQAGVPALLDTSGAHLREGVKAGPTLVKPNGDEIAQLLGHPAQSEEELLQAGQELHRGGIPYVVLSMGGEGALLVCAQGALRAKAPRVPVANTVGCGDAMVAALAVAMARKETPAQMLHYAVAVSSASAMALETGFFRREDMEANLRQVEVISL